VAAAEPSPVAHENADCAVLETHRGTRKVTVKVHYAAVRELRAMLDRADPQIAGMLRGRWVEDAIEIEHAVAGAAADAVGLFRAQPGGWTALTPSDRKKLEAAQLKCGIVVVVRTLAQRPWSATLFAVDGEEAETPLAEFPWDEYLLRNGWLLDLAPPVPRRPPPRPAAAEKPKSRRSWLAPAALLLVAGAGGAAAYRLAPRLWNGAQTAAAAEALPAAEAPAPELGLHVTHASDDFEVTWNRGAETIRRASAGSLTIRSGAATRVIDLRPDQLREGRVYFRPLAGLDTEVRLEVMDAAGKPEAESLQVLGFDTAPAVTMPAPPPAIAPGPPAKTPAPHAAPPAAVRSTPLQSADREEAASETRRPSATILTPSGHSEATAVHRASPEMTADALKELRNAKGKVTISVLVSIDAAGRVDDAKVVGATNEPSPSGEYLRLASLNAARQWRFRPATANGHGVESHATLTFTF
jgi:hypothetical protein